MNETGLSPLNFAPVYAIYRFFYRAFQFFRHWYVNSFFILGRSLMNFLEAVDKTFALKITWRNFFVPLYQDYTVLGRILGVVFRFLRILVGGTIYLAAVSVFLAAYFIWALVPAYIIFRIIIG